jgi:CRP-like cAMP-binding protein
MDVRSTFRRSPALAALPDNSLDSLVEVSSLQRLRRGEALRREGEMILSVVVIGHGLVRESVPSIGTRPGMALLFGPGETPGIAEVTRRPRSAWTTEAAAETDPVIVARIPIDPYLDALAAHAGAAMGALEETAGHACALLRRLMLASAPADVRIATEIIDLADRFGDELEGGGVLVPLRLTRAELAGLCGVSPTTAAHTISAWTHAGILSTHDGAIRIDNLARLQYVANGTA